MDEFVLFGKVIADPFLRIGPIRKPVLLMVEFCQIQGPRPLFSHPKNGDYLPHFLEEVSLWVMCSENIHGNFSSLYNQQLGVHILVQYATVLDITARALQRPFAIALILPDQPSTELTVAFQKNIAECLLPLLSCNRNYISQVIAFAAQLIERSELKNFQSYYSTAGNAQQIVIISNRIKGIVQQSKPWYDRYIATTAAAENCCDCECSEKDFTKFLQILGNKQTTQLTNLMELAPCFGRNYFDSLKRVYSQCMRSRHDKTAGLMFSGNQAVIRSTFGANSQKAATNDDSDGRPNVDDIMHQIPYPIIGGSENSLKSLSFRLVRILYPLLAGEKILILGSRQRDTTGMDLMYKLNKIRVAKRTEKIEWNFKYNQADSEMDRENQISGYSCSRDKSLKWISPGVDHDLTVVDLNNHKIRCHQYSGRFLSCLSGNRLFPSENAVMDFVTAVVTDIFQFVLLAKSISPESVVEHFGLCKEDKLILFHNLVELNLTKYIRLKVKAREIQQKIPFVIQRF